MKEIGKAGIRIVEAILVVVQIILLLRGFLEFFGAGRDSAASDTLYTLGDAVLLPFSGAFEVFELGSFDLNLNVILAILVYGILGYILVLAIQILFDISHKEEKKS